MSAREAAAASQVAIVVAGGGTGGHLFPGIAVARELLARLPNARISFAGTSRGIEARVVPREGFPLDLIRIGGLKGKSLAERARGAGLVPLGLVDAWRLLSRRRPGLVIGVGGYSAGPVVLAAALRGIPTLLLEQNAVPGLTNRLLAPFVRAAAVSFQSTSAFFGAKAFLSGNPVRPDVLKAATFRDASRVGGDAAIGTTLLVFGGSQGAHAINVAMVEGAGALKAALPDLRLVHQTGERDLAAVREAYRTARLAAEVEPFFDDLPRRLALSDLVVCRAGATTLAEITAMGACAILVPLPTATDDHQRQNALALAASGGAEVLLQPDLTGRALVDRIVRLAGDGARRRHLSEAARAQGRPDAAAVIVDRALALIDAPRPA
jgi:UDP-N-acetylglucosamine--N-acetylmuramyl-(pentapeptide) pyrophosphoryl-undecaprenol N-acetylglucosamine transferase